MPKVNIYSKFWGEKTCPPTGNTPDRQDVGGHFKIDKTWLPALDVGTKTPALGVEVSAGEHFIRWKQAMGTGFGGRCVYVPVRNKQSGTSVQPINVTQEGQTFCGDFVCATADQAHRFLSGNYNATRHDKAEVFASSISFRPHASYCLTGDIASPGSIDHAYGYMHLSTENAQHRPSPHEADGGQVTGVLSAGNFEGNFVSSDGLRGRYELKLVFGPAEGEAVTVSFDGFLIYEAAPTAMITFVRDEPVVWVGSEFA